MKKPLYLLSFVLVFAAACQQQTVPVQVSATAVTVPAAPKAAALPTPAPATVATAVPTPEMLAFLRQYAVGKLLVRDDGPLNGFIGPEHYRTELVLTAVVPDSSQSNLYRVSGKSRYKNVMTPLSGSITLTQLFDQANVAGLDKNKHQEPENTYSAVGTFELVEDSTVRGAGRYAGTVVIDFLVGADQQLEIYNKGRHTASRDGGITLDGTWTSLATKRQKPVVWVYYIWSYGESVLKNFNVGERGPEVNPKYAKLGWGEFWENDEWWHEAEIVTAEAASDSL
ncbi:hypothetical protein LGH70_18140 [Hymenobacter sp. BT635]|uniref:Uncharacterized protein n=1 Tax=Hymenobacter nitidus TaxID=2880929 RepID=A0ABS8AGF8_9BACT|nr:hypothetical protein [Hymenobacter nitidus]MCB2379523.1 hypothetical protein [Hymenobacter nitidus]